MDKDDVLNSERLTEKDKELLIKLDQESQEVNVSVRHKKRMNRIFREYAACDEIPYPDVDNFFERFRSRIVLLFLKMKKLNKNKR